MESNLAIEALGALAQETRLAVFRLLVKAGAAGMTAGTIARTLEVAPSTLSSHLGILERAGLLQSWRVQRQIFYAADYAGVRDLLAFLTEDCCQGRPEICATPGAGVAAIERPNEGTGAS
jgi:DNA-binding transcriptional ArsR family regulator